jgi:hypothetical protein
LPKRCAWQQALCCARLTGNSGRFPLRVHGDEMMHQGPTKLDRGKLLALYRQLAATCARWPFFVPCTPTSAQVQSLSPLWCTSSSAFCEGWSALLRRSGGTLFGCFPDLFSSARFELKVLLAIIQVKRNGRLLDLYGEKRRLRVVLQSPGLLPSRMRQRRESMSGTLMRRPTGRHPPLWQPVTRTAFLLQAPPLLP